ncbi:MAG: phosphatase PAP2 family protein [Pseudomonadota bacterium]
MTWQAGIAVVSVLALFLGAFLFDPIVMRALAHFPESLIGFADLTTQVGNSAWLGILLPFIMLVAAFIEVSARSPSARRNAALTLRLAITLFLLMLISGIAVQLFKHSLGRARPTLFEELGPYMFRPYALSFSFNSFPSGHATTLGALALFLCWLWPARRSVVLLATIILAATRVVLGKHYPSDVLAGLLLGAGTTYVFGRAILRAGLIPKRTDPVFRHLGRRIQARAIRFARRCSWTSWTADPPYVSLLIGTLIALNLSMVLFLAAPEIDLSVSRLFFDPERGFWMAEDETLTTLRLLFLRTTQITGLTAVIAYVMWWRLRSHLSLPKPIIAYVAAAFAIGPGLLVNAVLKAHWGRARPANIEEFGGWKIFTFPFERADQCLSNCSFVSGEGAGIAMTAILAGTLIWPWLKTKSRLVWAAGIGVALLGIGLRIAMGRHFLSDSVFAVLLMALIALILYRWCAIGHHRRRLTWDGVLHDLRVLGTYFGSRPNGSAPTLTMDAMNALRAVARVLLASGEVLQAIGTGIRRQYRGLGSAEARRMRVSPGE